MKILNWKVSTLVEDEIFAVGFFIKNHLQKVAAISGYERMLLFLLSSIWLVIVCVPKWIEMKSR